MNRKRTRSGMLPAFLIGGTAVLLTLYAVIVVAAAEFQADFTDTILWGEATFNSGKLFDPGFSYATAMPFGGQWLMIPFLSIWGVGMPAQTMGMLLFALLLMLAIVMLGRKVLELPPVWTAILLAAAVLGLSGSMKMRELYWGHVIYYSLGSLFLLVGLTVATRLVVSAKKRKVGNMSGIRMLPWFVTGVWIFLCSLNGFHSLVTVTLPLTGALAFEGGLAARKTRHAVPYWSMAVVCFVSAAAGIGVGAWLKAGVPTWYSDYYVFPSNIGEWGAHLTALPHDLLLLYGVNPDSGMNLLTVAGLSNLVHLLGTVVFTVAPFLLLAYSRRQPKPGIRLLASAHVLLTGLLVSAYVFGRISNAYWRMSPLVFTGILATVLLVFSMWRMPRLKRIAVLLLAVTALYALSAAVQIASTPPTARQQNRYYLLADFLEEQDLRQGYATFWNANSVTVQSDGHVRVAPVNLDKTGPVPYHYQSHLSWYLDTAARTRWFLLVSQAEYEIYYADREPLDLEPDVVLEAPEGYRVLLFDQNPVPNP